MSDSEGSDFSDNEAHSAQGSEVSSEIVGEADLALPSMKFECTKFKIMF